MPKFIILLIPLSLSAFTHLWNADGFPNIYRDEDHYLRKTLHVLRGLGPQEGPTELLSYPLTPYTHPYFGQLFLAALLGATGYPDSLKPSTNVSSIKEIFLLPRILMGILAVLDTFLLFKIAERRYNTSIALISSILFAVMPLTWIIRRIWLEPIQLPFLLTSILLALYTTESRQTLRTLSPLIISGICLGLAIFTKVPIVAMIPFIGYIIQSNTRSFSLVGLWITPILLIPMIWPLYAISHGEFDAWLKSIFWQIERHNAGLLMAVSKLFTIDSVLIILSFIGFTYAAIRRRDLFLVLWIVPFILLNFFNGYVDYWHLIPIIPVFCIGSAILITDVSKVFHNRKIKIVLPYMILTGLTIYGLVVTTLLISLNLTSFHYEVISTLSREIQNASAAGNIDKQLNGSYNNIKLTVLGNNYFLWFPKYLFDKNDFIEFKNYYHGEDLQTKKALLVVGYDFINQMTGYTNTNAKMNELAILVDHSNLISRLQENQTAIPDKNKFPFNSLINLDPRASTVVEIRTN